MNGRRRLTGVVASNKMQKTVVVVIDRTFQHPLYKKVVHTAHKVKAHDELGCQIGDTVQVVESRPFSAQVRWVVQSIVRHGIEPEMIIDTPERAEEEPTEAAQAEPVQVETEQSETEQGE